MIVEQIREDDELKEGGHVGESLYRPQASIADGYHNGLHVSKVDECNTLKRDCYFSCFKLNVVVNGSGYYIYI